MFKEEFEKYVWNNFADIRGVTYSHNGASLTLGHGISFTALGRPKYNVEYNIRYDKNLAENVFNIISRENYPDKDLESWAVHLTNSNFYLDDIMTADHLGKMLFLLSTGKLPEDALKEFAENRKVDFCEIFKDVKARCEVKGDVKLHKIVFDYDNGTIDVYQSIKLKPVEFIDLSSGVSVVELD